MYNFIRLQYEWNGMSVNDYITTAVQKRACLAWDLFGGRIVWRQADQGGPDRTKQSGCHYFLT